MLCILPALWMTSCFHTMGSVIRIKHYVMFQRSNQVAVNQLDVRQLGEFIRM